MFQSFPKNSYHPYKITQILPRYLTSRVLFCFIISIISRTWSLCLTINDNNWSSLESLLSTSGGFLLACPFIIEGTNCQSSGLGFDVIENLYLQCDSTSSIDDHPCVINCTGRHFNIHALSKLTLDGVTLRGSESSSVHLENEGSLETRDTHFERNWKDSGLGGAIYAEGTTSSITIFRTYFFGNEADHGGAIFYNGNATIEESFFIQNHATEGNGGGIFSGGVSGVSTWNQNLFRSNFARFFGPAIFSFSHNSLVNENNIACENDSSNGITCDGVFDVDAISCLPFENVCSSAPSAAPTVAKSDSPSSQPSNSPTSRPSMMPQTTGDLCSYLLSEADSDNDLKLSFTEYVEYAENLLMQAYGETMDMSGSLRLVAAFTTIACSCAEWSGNYRCCIGNNAHVMVSGSKEYVDEVCSETIDAIEDIFG